MYLLSISYRIFGVYLCPNTLPTAYTFTLATTYGITTVLSAFSVNKPSLFFKFSSEAYFL